MESLTIVLNEDNTVEVKNGSEMSFGTALGLFADGLECLLSHGVLALEDDIKSVDELHDYISYSLTSVLARVFPDMEDFSFTDAAVYKAQNELLEESMERGIPIEDLIQEYNNKAQEYIDAQKTDSHD